MIDDPELRSLFQTEIQERITSIEKNLSTLEKNTENEKIWIEVLRDVHTMKGSARMLKIQSIEVLSHRFEDILILIYKEHLKINPALTEFFYEITAGILSFVSEEVEGIPAMVDMAGLLNKIKTTLAKLKSEVPPEVKPQIEAPPPSDQKQPAAPATEIPQPGPKAPPPDQKQPTPKPAFQKPQAAPLPDQKQPTPTLVAEPPPISSTEPKTKIFEKELHISTIRVNIEQINTLMTQVIELSVVRNNIDRLFEQIEEIVSLWEEKKQYRELSFFLDSKKLNKEEFEKFLEDKMSLLRNSAYDKIHRLELVSASLENEIRRLSLIPISKLFDLFPPMVRELAKSAEKEIEFSVVSGEDIVIDRKIIENIKDPLMHILRNAISHGIEPPTLRQQAGKPAKGKIEVSAKQTEQSIIIEISDDGYGLNIERIKSKAIQLKLYTEAELKQMSEEEIQMIIFRPGLSTALEVSDVSGRGFGLDVVQAAVESLHGSVSVKSQPRQGTTFIIELAINFITTKVMLVQQEKKIFAIPIDMIDNCILISSEQILTLEDQEILYFLGHPIPVFTLSNLLTLEGQKISSNSTAAYSCLILKQMGKRIALLVDSILEEQKLVILPPNKQFIDIKGLYGITILKNGEVCLVINPLDLIKFARLRAMGAIKEPQVAKKKKTVLIVDESYDRKMLRKILEDEKYEVIMAQDQVEAIEKIGKPKKEPSKKGVLVAPKKKKTVLIVDDSATARMILKQVLENENFNTILAEDGLDALEKLKETKVDAVVTDLDMPNMNGLELTSYIRLHYFDYLLPIIIFSSKGSAEDVKRGMDVGVTSYIVKSEYNQQNLINALKEFLEL